MEVKKWYESKLTWLGIITTVIGVLEVVGAWMETASFQPQDFTALAVGVLTVVLRVWFTNTTIKA
jgi:hypothetical protein